MKELRYGLIALMMLFCFAATSEAQVSIGIGLPNLSIGINLPLYPNLVPIPGYPVYYAPTVEANYFFYDGMYWIYYDDNWYASYWYNGPWSIVRPEIVPLFILRVPVRYYRHPPVYFHGWRPNEPPRWGEHWGPGWAKHRHGWDKWRRSDVPRRAPLPMYQKHYSGNRYPDIDQQRRLRSERYKFDSRDKAVRQHFKEYGDKKGPTPRTRYEEPKGRSMRQDDDRRFKPSEKGANRDVQMPPPQQPSHPQYNRGPMDMRKHPAPEYRKQDIPKDYDRGKEIREGDKMKGQGEHGEGHKKDK
jgi:hypothetical protein